MTRPAGRGYKFHGAQPSPWKDHLALATLALLGVALLLGGASRLNAVQVALVELSALPLLAIIAGRELIGEAWSRHRALLLILLGVMAIPLVQLIPLPPALWTRLPGREDLVVALDLAGVAQGWNGLTLKPDRTTASALALIPPVTMLLAVLTGHQRLGVWLAKFLLAAAAVSIVLGAAQLASGSTQFYLWPTTDAGNVVGFFANRNHLATMLVMALPFAAAFAAQESYRGAGRSAQWMAIGFLGLLLIALAGIGSRAGMLLLGLSLGLSMAIWLTSAAPRLGRRSIVAIAICSAGLLVVAALVFAPVLERFEGLEGQGGRLDNWRVILQTIPTYLPVGAGTGAFDAVYRSVEPLSRLDPTYFNQAHNDWLEILLESGLLGAAALVAFTSWWAVRTFQVWKARDEARFLGRAASSAILMLLLHSSVDYPVRTLAIAVVLAMCVGILERSVRARSERSRT